MVPITVRFVTLFFSKAVNAGDTPPTVTLIVFETCAANDNEIQHNTTENSKHYQ